MPEKVEVTVAGSPSSALHRVGPRDRLAERDTLRQIEGDRDRGQLAQLVDAERADRALDLGEGADRHQRCRDDDRT